MRTAIRRAMSAAVLGVSSVALVAPAAFAATNTLEDPKALTQIAANNVYVQGGNIKDSSASATATIRDITYWQFQRDAQAPTRDTFTAQLCNQLRCVTLSPTNTLASSGTTSAFIGDPANSTFFYKFIVSGPDRLQNTINVTQKRVTITY